MGRCTSIGVRTAATGNARLILAAATTGRRPRRSALLPPRILRATGIWSVASRIANADAAVLPCWTAPSSPRSPEPARRPMVDDGTYIHAGATSATSDGGFVAVWAAGSEGHTSELQYTMRISYAVF